MVKLVLLMLLACPLLLEAQVRKITPQDLLRKHSFLLMRDGSVVRGQVIKQDSSVITVRKRNGDFTFVEADQLVNISARPFGQPLDETIERTPDTYTTFFFKDGTQVEGKFIRRDSTMITVRKRTGQLTYFEPELLDHVDSARVSTSAVPVRPTYPNQFSAWLLNGQTAYTAEKGRFYYRNTFLLLNELTYGITRNWSVGVSANPFFTRITYTNSARETALGANVRLFSKLSVPIGTQFRVGVSTMYQPSQRSGFYSINGVWTLNGLASFGNSQRNVTLGFGKNIYQSTRSTDESYITAGVMHKLSRSITFLSDNTFFLNPFTSGSSAYLSVALRIDRRRHAFDLGALAVVQPRYYFTTYNSVTQTNTYFTPYIGYNLLLGR